MRCYVSLEQLEAFSVPQHPHHPTRHKNSAGKQDEAIESVANLFAGVLRWVIPKTTEANTENRTAAVKWESSRVIRFSDHGFFPMAIW